MYKLICLQENTRIKQNPLNHKQQANYHHGEALKSEYRILNAATLEILPADFNTLKLY